jgi:hypothetical protein
MQDAGGLVHVTVIAVRLGDLHHGVQQHGVTADFA